MFGFLSPANYTDWRPWAIRIAGAGVFAGILAYLPYRVLDGPSAVRLSEMRAELARAEVEMEQLAEDNVKLRRDIRALKEDPRAIEDIARKELGMAFSGDLVIRLERDR